MLRNETPESYDPLLPVASEFRIGDPFAGRGLVKPILIGDDADMTEVVKENKSSKFESIVTGHWFALLPKAPGASPFKIYSCVFKNTPHKPRTIVAIGTSS